MNHPVLDLDSQINLDPGTLQAGRQLFDWYGLQQLVRNILRVSE